MGKNLSITKNRIWIASYKWKKENKSGHRIEVLRIWRRQRPVTSHVASTLDGISVKVDNLLFVEQLVLHGEISLLEAFFPELLKSLVNFQEEEE
jgi:hypothetical protein